MAIYIEMPKLSDTMTEGTLLKWLKNEGDKVTSGDALAEIETDKATMEMEAFDDGILHKHLVAAGGKAQVGAKIALLLEKGEQPPAEGRTGSGLSQDKVRQGGHDRTRGSDGGEREQGGGALLFRTGRERRTREGLAAGEKDREGKRRGAFGPGGHWPRRTDRGERRGRCADRRRPDEGGTGGGGGGVHPGGRG